MTTRKINLICRRTLRRSRFLQILLLIAFWLVGDVLVRWLGLPVPGGVIGMFILIALFASGSFSPLNVRLGAEWFLAEMLLFFIPAVPAILNHHEFLGWLGLKVLVVILVGTAVVMIVTASVVDACFRWNSRHKPMEVKQP
jgi:holin-like protein